MSAAGVHQAEGSAPVKLLRGLDRGFVAAVKLADDAAAVGLGVSPGPDEDSVHPEALAELRAAVREEVNRHVNLVLRRVGSEAALEARLQASLVREHPGPFVPAPGSEVAALGRCAEKRDGVARSRARRRVQVRVGSAVEGFRTPQVRRHRGGNLGRRLGSRGLSLTDGAPHLVAAVGVPAVGLRVRRLGRGSLVVLLLSPGRSVAAAAAPGAVCVSVIPRVSRVAAVPAPLLRPPGILPTLMALRRVVVPVRVPVLLDG